MTITVKLNQKVTNATSSKSVDLEKVSQNVKNQVKNAQALGGNSQKIDSKEEHDLLFDFYKGNCDAMNKHEQTYIANFLKEYNEEEAIKAKENDEKIYRESITDYVKNCIKKIMEIGGNKEKIDTQLEVDFLHTLLKNENGDLNAADIRFVRETLNEANGQFNDSVRTNEPQATTPTEDAPQQESESQVDVLPQYKKPYTYEQWRNKYFDENGKFRKEPLDI